MLINHFQNCLVWNEVDLKTQGHLRPCSMKMCHSLSKTSLESRMLATDGKCNCVSPTKRKSPVKGFGKRSGCDWSTKATIQLFNCPILQQVKLKLKFHLKTTLTKPFTNCRKRRIPRTASARMLFRI